MGKTNIEKRKVKSGDIASHVLIAGKNTAPPLVLLHGAGPGVNAAANWEAIMPDLAEKFYVVAPDLSGFGKTDIPTPQPWHIMGWIGERVKQVLGMMDELGIEKAFLVGNSMGGALALQLLCEAPNRFVDSVLMGSIGAPFTRTPELANLLSFYADPRKARYRQMMHSFAYDADKFTGRESIVEKRYKIATDPAVRENHEKMFGSMQGGMESLIMAPSILKKIPHKLLIFHGRQDRIVPLETSLYLIEHLKNAELLVLDKCGHWAQLERWDLMRPMMERHFGATL